MNAELHAAHVTLEREFVCVARGQKGVAVVTGMGEGASTFLNSDGTGARRANEDALRDVDSTLAVAACPSCGARNVTAMARWWLRNAVAPVAIFTLVLGVLTMAPTWFDLGIEPEEQRKLVWAMSGVGVCTILLMLPLPVWMKWRSTQARVRWK